MTSVIVRIGLRYAAAALIARGLLSEEVGGLVSDDPDIAMMVEVTAGLAIGAAVEGWYFLARRLGWGT